MTSLAAADACRERRGVHSISIIARLARRPTLASLLICLGLAACGHDAADREYLAALAGEEQDLTRAQQIAHIDRAIALAPSRGRYWETRAIYQIDQRDFARAIVDLDQAIALQARPYLYFLRGLALCQDGRCAEALRDFDQAIAKQPDNLQFYRGRSLARTAEGRATEALDDAERLVRLAPHQAESWHARGKALAGLGRHREAIADYAEASRLRPELVYPLLARADSHDQLGDPTGAATARAQAEVTRRERGAPAAYIDPFRY